MPRSPRARSSPRKLRPAPEIAADRVTAAPPDAHPLVRPVRKTPGIGFLNPPDAFLDALGARVERLEKSEAEIDSLLGSREDPVVVLLAPPLATTALS